RLPDAGGPHPGLRLRADRFSAGRIGGRAVRFGLIMSEVGNGLRRNVSMVISVVLVTFISLTFVGAAILLQMQIGELKGYWYDRAQVAVYLCTDTVASENCNLTEATDAEKQAVEGILDSPQLAP